MKKWEPMKKFKINNRQWSVEFFEDLDDESSLTRMGLTVYADQKIFINRALRYDVLYTTLIHELTHAFRWSYGFIIEDETKYSSSHFEEMMANFMECFGEQIIELTRKLYKQLDEERNGKTI